MTQLADETVTCGSQNFRPSFNQRRHHSLRRFDQVWKPKKYKLLRYSIKYVNNLLDNLLRFDEEMIVLRVQIAIENVSTRHIRSIHTSM